MLFLLIALGLIVGVRAAKAVMASLASLPRSNEDWIYY